MEVLMIRSLVLALVVMVAFLATVISTYLSTTSKNAISEKENENYDSYDKDINLKRTVDNLVFLFEKYFLSENENSNNDKANTQPQALSIRGKGFVSQS